MLIQHQRLWVQLVTFHIQEDSLSKLSFLGANVWAFFSTDPEGIKEVKGYGYRGVICKQKKKTKSSLTTYRISYAETADVSNYRAQCV